MMTLMKGHRSCQMSKNLLNTNATHLWHMHRHYLYIKFTQKNVSITKKDQIIYQSVIKAKRDYSKMG